MPIVRGVAAAAVLLAACLTAFAGDVILITDEEASLPPAKEVSVASRALTRGPGIVQVRPGPEEPSRRPVDLEIRFEPRNGVPIDPGQVRVTYLKQTPVDLTARVEPFVSASGIRLPQAIVPSGKHLVRVDVTDARGRQGSAVVVIQAR